MKKNKEFNGVHSMECEFCNKNERGYKPHCRCTHWFTIDNPNCPLKKNHSPVEDSSCQDLSKPLDAQTPLCKNCQGRKLYNIACPYCGNNKTPPLSDEELYDKYCTEGEVLEEVDILYNQNIKSLIKLARLSEQKRILDIINKEIEEIRKLRRKSYESIFGKPLNPKDINKYKIFEVTGLEAVKEKIEQGNDKEAHQKDD